MKIIWLGHGSFRIETAGQVLLIDPWLTGNPMLAEDQHDAALAGATHILLTHAHFDHAADVLQLARTLNAPLVGQYDLMGYWGETEEVETIGFNKGGTVDLNGPRLAMVPASHSSSFSTPRGVAPGRFRSGFHPHERGKNRLYFRRHRADGRHGLDW